MVLRQMVNLQAAIRRQDVMQLCHLTADQAKRLLIRLVDRGLLRMAGERRLAPPTKGSVHES